MGENGAGKTTALECIEGLRRPDGGSIAVRGRLGVQLQSGALPSCLRAMEAVRLFALWNHHPAGPGDAGGAGRRPAGEADLRADVRRPAAAAPPGAGAAAGAGRAGARRAHRRAGSGRAAGAPRLHSPPAGTRGRTILLSSHDAAEVETLCDRLAVLREGRAAFCGTPAELAARQPRTICIRTDRGELRREAGDLGRELRTLLEQLEREGARVLDVEIGRGSLEEHLLELLEEKS